MYQREARGLAGLGRGPDTELVHMTPREVGALDNLARRNGLAGLPTNPQTGLPEAGIFDNILPTLIGIGAVAAAPFTGGASTLLANPWVLGGGAALDAGLATGFDTAQMAKWGLGVGGGASIGNALAGAGAGTTAGEAARQTAQGKAGFTAGTADHMAMLGGPPGRAYGGELAKSMSSTLSPSAQAGLNVGNMGRAFSSEGLKNLAGKGAEGLALGKAPIAASLASMAAHEYTKTPEPYDIAEKEQPFYPEGGFMPPPRDSIDPFAGDPAGADFSEERLYFDPAPFTPPGYTYRTGGLVPLQGGGLTRGPGDGMSDDIMLPITGSKDIAAVSPDEFVVPADVVSGLGNGSTSAGAKQLYGMMDRVRGARTGKTSQPRAINAGEMMPV